LNRALDRGVGVFGPLFLALLKTSPEIDVSEVARLVI